MRRAELISPAGDDYSASIDRDGFAVTPAMIGEDVVESLRAALDALIDGDEFARGGIRYGVRNVLTNSAEIRRFAGCAAARSLVEPVLGADCFAVRCTYFDKVPAANWRVAYHQDNVIAVRERSSAAGFRGWSNKKGVWQVEPPVEVLEGMLAIRVHLDRCGADNGPLRVLAGSHQSGRLEDEFDSWKQRTVEYQCEPPLGGVVAMRPLLLHASSPAEAPSHRRVLHFEYARHSLPGGLEWRDQIGAIDQAED